MIKTSNDFSHEQCLVLGNAVRDVVYSAVNIISSGEACLFCGLLTDLSRGVHRTGRTFAIARRLVILRCLYARYPLAVEYLTVLNAKWFVRTQIVESGDSAT